MKYIVLQNFLLSEGKKRQLTGGQPLQDGDLEPDVMAQLVSQGTVIAGSAQSPDLDPEWTANIDFTASDGDFEAMTLPDEDMPDETPPKRTRGRG